MAQPPNCDNQGQEDLREFFNTKIENVLTLITGNDRNYKTQFDNAKEAVSVALAAQEKSTANAFLASEKAIVKAEDAQKDYNARSNEFRGQLDDQAKTLMPRLETVGLFKSMDDKLIAIQASFESKLAEQRISNEKIFDAIVKDIASLRESRSGAEGKVSQQSLNVTMILAVAALIIGIAEVISRFIK